MHDHPATLITGTAPFSLGASLVSTLCSRYPESPVVAIDKQHNPILDGLSNARWIDFDLNPLASKTSYERFSDDLYLAIQIAQQQLGFPGVNTAVLAAACYDSGMLVDSSIESRMRLVGVNVCGKIEMLHALLRLNRTLDFNSSNGLTLVDIGSLHGLAASAGRSVYSATKAFGLDLSLSLELGREVKRVIHMAPGPIDTHMLHRNHWVTKEQGSVEFFDRIRAMGGSLYEDVFVRCDDAAFNDAASFSSTDKAELDRAFDGYKRRREEQFKHADGVLLAHEAANWIVEILADEAAYPECVYILTAPGRQVHVEKLSFNDVVRRQV